MKALIVDDEKHVRDAIKLLVNWSLYGIATLLEAENGAIAARLIEEERPELILLDMMMPIKNGAELLEWIGQHAPLSKAVVISGYNDFELVRHTMKSGGLDYILKPIDAEQLNEAVGHAARSWREEERVRLQNQQRSIQLNVSKPAYWDKRFSNFIHDPGGSAAFVRDLRAEFGVSGELSSGQVAILSLEPMARTIRRKFAHDRDSLFFAVTNICNELLRRQNAGYAFRYWNGSNEVVILGWGEPADFGRLAAETNEALKQTLGGRFHIGIGSPAAFPGGLPGSYKEARRALRQRNMLAKERWLHTCAGPRPPRIGALHFADYEEQVRVALQSADSGQLDAAAEAWFGAVRQLDTISPEQLERWQYEFDAFQARWLNDFSADDGASPFMPDRPDAECPAFDEDGRLSIDGWARQWTASLSALAKRSVERLAERSVTREIADYIDQHYYKDVTLQSIAERFFLSREYISRKFKQEQGENISDYIGKVRIGKAKLLLLNPHLKIVQIAGMVGYQDEKYFSKVFKKIEGRSPNAYRGMNAAERMAEPASVEIDNK